MNDQGKNPKNILVIPDLHGSPKWKNIIDQEPDFDLCIFLGDYVDSFEYSSEDQLKNLEDVLKFKSDHAERVILLLGNHDIHYLPFIEKPYSGFQPVMAPVFRQLFTEAIDNGDLRMCYQRDRLLFTHAGVTNTWCEMFEIEKKDPMPAINQLLHDNPRALGFIYGNESPSPIGDNIFQSPTWVRPDSLLADGIDGFLQIVGHTVHERVTVRERGDEKYFFCDTFLHSEEYLKFIGDTIFEINLSKRATN